MVSRGGFRWTLLAAAVLPMLTACGSAAAHVKRGPQAIVVQPADVSGLSRCPQSGSPDTVVRALRNGGNGGDGAGADRLAGNWSDDQGRGGQDAYVAGFAASPSDCLRIFGSYATGDINGLQNKWVVNYIVAFPSDRQAQATWAQRASYLQNFENTIGKSTGLGDHAVVIDAYPGQWFAAWSDGSSYSMLATNYDTPMATTLAAKVAARMHQ